MAPITSIIFFEFEPLSSVLVDDLASLREKELF
jgi:hypothetical protein